MHVGHGEAGGGRGAADQLLVQAEEGDGAAKDAGPSPSGAGEAQGTKGDLGSLSLGPGSPAALLSAAAESKKLLAKNTARAVETSGNWPKSLQCLACCCCWTFSGLRDLLTSGSTIEFAVGFIVGEQFSAIIYAAVEFIVTPLLFALFDAGNIAVESASGFLVLTNPQEVTIVSEQQATDDGCLVLSYIKFFQALLSFLVVMGTMFWIINMLQRVSRERSNMEDDEAEADLVECIACVSRISSRATRCPHCTSFVGARQQDSLDLEAG